MTTNAMDTLLALKCGTCGGRGAVKGPDLQVYRYDCPECNATGLRYWRLRHEGRVFEGAGATPLEALAAAIKASVEVNT